MPNAKVTALRKDTGTSTPGKTVTDGVCILNVSVGWYEVEVRYPGFAEFRQHNVQVSASNTVRVDAVLKPGTLNEVVEVTAEAPTLQTEASNLGTPLSAQQMASLPVNGRNFIDLMTMPDNSGKGVSVNGSRSVSSTWQVDGADVEGSYVSGVANGVSTRGAASMIPSDAVMEYSVQANSYGEFGGNSGLALNVVTKSGSNQLQGGLSDQLLNDALDSRDFFNLSVRKNKLRYNDFSGHMGGRFKLDKAFWFVSYEGRRDSLESTTVAAVPTLADFAQAITGLGGNPAIPPEQNPVVNPVVRNLLLLCASAAECPGGRTLWPLPVPELAGQVLNSSAPAGSHHRLDNAFLRLDFAPTDRNRLFAYYAFSDGSDSSPVPLAGSDPLPQMNTRDRFHRHLVTGSYDRTLSSRSVNNLRFSWSRYSTDSLDDDAMHIGNPSSSIGLNTGVSNARDFGLPQLRVRGFAPVGASPYANSNGREKTDWQVEDQLSWTPGKHNLKLGYEFRRNITNSFNDVNHRGLLEFASLQDFLAGQPARGTISAGDSNRTFARSPQVAYIQDSYRWRSSVTLDVGIRWDYFGVLRESQKLLSKYDPSLGLIDPDSLYRRDLNNFGPRLGVAWDVNGRGKTVFRAGAGYFFNAVSQDVLVGQVQFNTFNPGVAYNALAQEPILTSSSPVSVLQAGVPVFPLLTFSSDTRDVWTLGDIRTPYVLNYNADFQHDVLSGAALQVGYVGSSGRKLLRVRDINAPSIPGGTRPFATAAPLSVVAPNPPFVVNQIETSASSNFNALQVSFKQQYPWRNWQNYVLWTLSHSIDDASDGIDWTPNRSLPNNSRFPQDRASSSFDQRHSFLWHSIYDFPYSSGHDWLKGWRIGGSLVLRSGQPYHINFADEFDTQGAYDFILRPDLVGNAFLGTSTPSRLLNLAAFQVPCTLDGLGTTVAHCLPGTLHFGNLSRNAFVGPRFAKLDFSLSKTIKFGERWNLQLRADALNLTNHPIFASPLLPRYIALASLKGIGLNGQAGAAGANCNSATASVDCYLPVSATPDAAASSPSQGSGARTVQVSAKISF